MLALERMPHRVGEEFFGEIVHSLGNTSVGVFDVRDDDRGADKSGSEGTGAA
jgi:hypothetical protein